MGRATPPLSRETLDRDTRRLLAQLPGAGIARRDQLIAEVVEANTPVARVLTLRYAGPAATPQDVDAITRAALVETARRYAPQGREPFLVSAIPVIRRRCKRWSRERAQRRPLRRPLRRLARALPHDPHAVGEARAAVRTFGAALPGNVVDDAQLLVSELVGNAVRHGGDQITLEVLEELPNGALAEDLLTVRVYDDGPDLPARPVQESAADVVGGRGLRMIDRLALRWGVEPAQDGHGKTVWCSLATGRTNARPGADEPEDR